MRFSVAQRPQGQVPQEPGVSQICQERTEGMVAAGFAIFGLAAKYLPIFEDENKHAAATPEPVLAREAVMSNAD